jgi:hypothetical protein
MPYFPLALLNTEITCKRLTLCAGLVVIACSVVIAICADLSFRLKEPLPIRWWIAAIDRLVIIGFVGASLIAIVGGLGVLTHALSRRRI